MLQLVGALLGMYLFTRLGLWLFRRRQLTPARIVITHSVMYVLAAVAAAYGGADGGEPKFASGFLTYILPTMILVMYDLYRAAGGAKGLTHWDAN